MSRKQTIYFLVTLLTEDFIVLRHFSFYLHLRFVNNNTMSLKTSSMKLFVYFHVQNLALYT